MIGSLINKYSDASNRINPDVDRSQYSNNVACMEGEYVSVEPDGHLTTNIN
jgi:hypothetical protein